MAEQPINMGFESAPAAGSPPLAPAPPPAAAPAPAPQQQPPQPAENPRARGHSPALDHREQQPAPGARMVQVGGRDYAESDVTAALAERVERQLAREGLPASPDKYEVRLPETFKAPEGMAFEIDNADPAMQEFRALAHRRGLDQSTFEEALGVFASTRIAELQRMNAAREAQMAALGSAGANRIDAVATWLNAKVGDKSKLMVAQLKQYPSAANVEALEAIIRAFSSQGGSTFTQSHREGQEDQGRIPGYSEMTFAERRIAQMNAAFRPKGGGR